MRVVPIQQAFDAFHFQNVSSLGDLLRFVKNEDGGRIKASVEMDGHAAQVMIPLQGSMLKVNRFEWVIRNESGAFKTMSDTEFKDSFQQAATEGDMPC